MSIETPDDNDIDLDVFAADFFGQKQATSEQASPEETDKDSDDVNVDAPASDEANPDDDTVDTDEDDENEEPVVEPELKPKKSRYQERIDELTAKSREAERRANELEAKLNELSNQNKKDTPAASKPVVDDTEPKPTDTNEDGTEKYPLGEYDPQYLEDRIRHVIARESKATREREEAERTAREFQAQEEALMTSWNEKLNTAKETYPDILEKSSLLEDTFRSLDPNYGKYLAATIMSMEFGTDVLNYLGNNLDEAKKIVDSGATRATIALGRIEGKFADAAAEKQISKPRVSQAPTPPPTNKGSAVALSEVPDDTDDLDAFSAKLFKKKK